MASPQGVKRVPLPTMEVDGRCGAVGCWGDILQSPAHKRRRLAPTGRPLVPLPPQPHCSITPPEVTSAQGNSDYHPPDPVILAMRLRHCVTRPPTVLRLLSHAPSLFELPPPPRTPSRKPQPRRRVVLSRNPSLPVAWRYCWRSLHLHRPASCSCRRRLPIPPWASSADILVLDLPYPMPPFPRPIETFTIAPAPSGAPTRPVPPLLAYSSCLQCAKSRQNLLTGVTGVPALEQAMQSPPFSL